MSKVWAGYYLWLLIFCVLLIPLYHGKCIGSSALLGDGPGYWAVGEYQQLLAEEFTVGRGAGPTSGMHWPESQDTGVESRSCTLTLAVADVAVGNIFTTPSGVQLSSQCRRKLLKTEGEKTAFREFKIFYQLGGKPRSFINIVSH